MERPARDARTEQSPYSDPTFGQVSLQSPTNADIRRPSRSLDVTRVAAGRGTVANPGLRWGRRVEINGPALPTVGPVERPCTKAAAMYVRIHGYGATGEAICVDRAVVCAACGTYCSSRTGCDGNPHCGHGGYDAAADRKRSRSCSSSPPNFFGEPHVNPPCFCGGQCTAMLTARAVGAYTQKCVLTQ
jgi:hypothetical protein